MHVGGANSNHQSEHFVMKVLTIITSLIFIGQLNFEHRVESQLAI